MTEDNRNTYKQMNNANVTENANGFQEINLNEIQLDTQQQQQQQTMQPQLAMPVITEQPRVHFGTLPQSLYCPACGVNGVTSISYVSGRGTILAAAVCCLICPLFFIIPFFTKPFKDVQHSCKSCGQRLGRSKLLNI